MKSIVIVLIIVAVIATGYFLYQGPLKPATKVQVTTATLVYPSQATSILNASGYVVAQRKAEVASKATGRLEELNVEEGTIVKKGAVLGRLENRDVSASLAQARADLEVEKAILVEAKSNFERRKRLVDEQLISAGEYDVAEAQYKRGIASVQSAEAKVNQFEVELENTYIRAPFNGTVLTKNADVGEIVAPMGSAGNSKGSIVSMADMTSLQVEADVSESNIERISVGQPCEITLDAFPEKRYRGAVHMIVPTADRAKATVMTKVRFVDKDERVLPEMSAKVTFLSEEISETQINSKPKLTVNPAAVVVRNQNKVVYVVKDAKAEERRVKLGSMVGSVVEVTEGLNSGEQVVLNPEESLETGTKIKIAQ
ncbi:MAG TPA: efflux RND transporter periplasmic adaptor subunit [Acidobacteriota bacterium]|nr:efflux RND transporter periplasmic adaptor subunit [Acidobacteriota bacterium]